MANESSLVQVNDKSFASEVLNSGLPVLVDFWATWCGPCRSIGPIVEELANEFMGKVKVTKLNVDESPATPSQYGVRGIPTLILFKDGKILDQIVGAVPKARLKAMIEKAL
jgi:thioredoxin 1